MKKLFRLFSLALLLASPFLLSTCKDEPNKPTISSLAPATGKEGDVVVINGTFLGSTSKILFGSAQAVVVDPQGASVTTQVPAGLTLGKVSVTVVNKGGNSNAMDFTVIPPKPEIQSTAPAKASSGMSVTVTGKYFTTVSSMTFGTITITSFNPKTDTELGIVIPDGLPLGATNFSVTTNGGTSDNASFTIVAKPTFTDFTPAAGPIGTHVTLSGTGFGETTGVFFQGVNTTAVFVPTSDALLDVTVPAGAATGKIKIVTAGGEIVSVNDFTVKGAPTITVFNPAGGAVGTLVTINGQNLNLAGVKVAFGGVDAPGVQIGSDVELKVPVPVNAASGKITVTTAAGTATSATDFSVVGAPTVASFSPANGIAGTSVTVNGTNFINVSSVKFNGIEVGAANFTVNSTIKITAKVPAGTTDGFVSVTTPSGTGTSGTKFVIIGGPVITGFTPTSGIVGTSVTITGTGFSNLSNVKFNGVTATTSGATATQVTAVVPATATTGKISLTTTAGTGTSTNDFTVLQAPFISSITPTSGEKGITLTITGTNLANATKVRFNTTDVTTLLSDVATQITVAVPNLGLGAVNVSVITAGGTSNTKTFTVTPHIDPAVITDLKPATSYKGFPIMIRGSNMKGATSVSIGSTTATIVTQYDASMIITIPGTIGNGTYNVTVNNGGGPSNTASLTIVTAPSGVGAPPGTNFVTPPPANYVNVISNDWGNGFTLSEFGDDPNCPVTSFSDATLCGHITFTKDGSGNVIANYIEITRGTGPTLETFYGSYSSAYAYPCVQHFSVISAKDGHVAYGTVIVNGGLNGYPADGSCQGPTQ